MIEKDYATDILGYTNSLYLHDSPEGFPEHGRWLLSFLEPFGLFYIFIPVMGLDFSQKVQREKRNKDGKTGIGYYYSYIQHPKAALNGRMDLTSAIASSLALGS